MTDPGSIIAALTLAAGSAGLATAAVRSRRRRIDPPRARHLAALARVTRTGGA